MHYTRHRLAAALLAFVLLAIPGMVHGETAAQVMRRASALMERAKGVRADFTLTSGGRSVKGTVKSSAAGFSVVTAGYSSWYDGRNMWTYNPSTAETTLVVPTREELREVNPLLMVGGYEHDFTASFVKGSGSGAYSILLTPKNAKTGLKSVTVVLNKSTYRPTSITVTPKSGAATKVTVNSLSTDAVFSKGDFTYPAKKYPKAELIDLR